MTTKFSYAMSIDRALPDGWVWSTLGEVADVVAGNPAPQGEEYFDGGTYPFVRVQDMGRLGASVLITDTNDKVNDRATAKLRLFPKGSVLFTKSGASTLLNQRGILGRDMYVVSHIAAAIPKDGIMSEWLYYWLRTVDFAHLAHATTLPSLPLSKASGIPIPVATYNEQQLIVAEIEKQFSRLDEAVAGLKRVKANLKRYKAAVLKAAVEGRLVETEAELARREGRSYETGEQLLKRILETRRSQWNGMGKHKEPAAPDTTGLPELPEGWTWAAMQQLGELNRGKSKHRPRDDKKLYGGPYPFIQTSDIRKSQGSIIEYSQTYSEFGLKQSRLWPAGTLCITIAANIAETGILNFAACFPDSIVGLLIEDGATTTQYVEYFIRTAREKLERFAPATAQKNINLEVLEAVAVPLPPFAEQQRIVAGVDRGLSLIGEIETIANANLKRAGNLRQSILKMAFSPQDPNARVAT